MADLRQQLISKYISPAQSQGRSFTGETDEPDLRQGLIDKYLSEGARRAYEEEKQAAIGDIRSRVGSLEDRWKKELENTQWRSQQDTAGFRADFTRERRALNEDIRRGQYKFGRADGALSKDLDFVRGDLERYETDLDKYQQYWGQWNSRDMYDNYTLGEQNKVLQKYASEQAAKAHSDYEQYLEDPAYLARQKEYAPIPYVQRSSGIAPEREPFETTEEGKRAYELKSKMDYWDRAVQQSQDESIRIRDMEEFYTWPEEDQKALREYADHRAGGAGTILGQSPWQFYLSNHKGAELAEKYGSEKLESIAESFTRTQNQDAAQQIAEKTREWTEKIPGAVGHSALSIGASVAGAVTGPMGYLGEAFNRTDRYSTLDPNNAGTVFGKYSGGVRGNVSENLREQGPFGKIADIIYQGGMSAMDSLARLAVGGEAGSLALAATGSFADTVSDASSRGASPWEATLMGIADGGLEVLTEKVSLDNLLSDIAESPRNFRQILKSAAIQGGVEVSEEELSFLGSLAAEAVILREKSSYNQRIAELMVEENKTQEEAKDIANKELWHEAVNTALVSFVSGDFMSTVTQGGAAIYDKVHNKQQVDAENSSEEGPLTSEEYKGILEQLQEPTPEQVQEEDMEIVNALHRAAYDKAFGIGQTGLDASYMEGIEHLTPEEKTEAYRQGAADAQETAIHMQQKNDSLVNGKTGYKKGTVKGEGVTIQDLRSTFNDTQNKAYKILSTYAEATGINIVLYKSEADANGNFQGEQGRFQRSDDTIYIDIHAGLKNVSSVNDLAKYTMVRTFGHEFTHFVEKWNPTEYNGFRKTVFAALEAKGENPVDLIEQKQAGNERMSFDQASREVIAEAMTDILPDSHFVEQLAAKNQTVFQQIKAKLHEFVAHLKEYFNALGHNRSREANALKEQIGDSLHYMENIVSAFDSVAVGAVESYQRANAVDEVTETVTETSETAVEKAENATESHEAEQETAETTQDNHTSEQENAAQEEAAAPQSEPRTFSSDNGYTVSENMEYGSWEIAFDGKPSEAVRAALKEHKFRWHRGKKVWYGKGDPTEIMESLDAAYKTAKENTEDWLDSIDTEAIKKELEDREKNGSPFVEKVLETAERIAKEESAVVEDKTAEEAPAESKTAETEPTKEVPTFEKLSTKKENWPARDITWFAPDRKTAIAYSTVATMNMIEALCEDNPTATVSELLNKVGYDQETKRVFHQFIAFGYGKENAKEFFGKNLRNDPNSEYTYRNPVKEEIHNETESEAELVLRSDPDGDGTSRLLESGETGDVPGNDQQRDLEADPGERGGQVGRSDNRSDAERNVGGSGEGSSQSGDLRESVNNTPLHEEVQEQIRKKSTVNPKGDNFVIGDSLDLPSGDKEKYKTNVGAIRLLKQLEAEKRFATAEEQKILSKYVGWGGLSNAFSRWSKDWQKEYTELKELLTNEEYRSANATVTDAFFTDIPVIQAMYDGLSKMGFTGGRILEPSCGVGNFIGAMPADIRSKVRSCTMVELDDITGRIARYLYPNADVRVEGFQDTNIPDNYMDVAIGNVPFGKVPVADKKYPKRIRSEIHNYFFAKALDKVHPGGIVMFITSSSTMNSESTAVRQYIMDRADLLGAIRLPETAFKKNAGTSVVADILVLKKREPGTAYSGVDFLNSSWENYGDRNGTYVNQYFTEHPEMVLGKPEFSGNFNSLTYKSFEDRGSLSDQIKEAFSHIDGKIEYPTKQIPEQMNVRAAWEGSKLKRNSYVVKDGKAYQNREEGLVKVDMPEATLVRLTGLLEIRDAARALQNAQQQGVKAAEIKKLRKKLNTVYDDFVKKHKAINTQGNKNALKNDPDRYFLLSLENYDKDTKTAAKTDIFYKDTISPNRTVTSAKNAEEGLIVSVNQTGGVDIPLISKLTGETESTVTRELIDSRKVFKMVDGSLETAQTYLSGNVRAKLREAEGLVPLDDDFQKNVQALKAVLPPTVDFQNIYVAPGVTWVPDSVYSDFAADMLGSNNYGWQEAVRVVQNKATGHFTVELKNASLKNSARNTQMWGTPSRSFLNLFEAMLNNKSVKVSHKDADGKYILDTDATNAANEKVENIQKEFQNWLWKDENRRKELSALYNETFNSVVTPQYDGTNLTVNGANALKPLRPHQKDAVQRIISSGGNTLLAHKVGAGKTYEMAAAAMKLKQLGLVKKPMFAVPKSLVAQWGAEFLDFFPAANILVAGENDFTPENRKIITNRIANGEYDAVILSYEQFEKIPISQDFAKSIYQEQIDEIIEAIEDSREENGKKSMSVKDLEKKRKQLEAKLQELSDKPKDEDNIDFEQLGVDSLFVDEAHNFKNLFYTTSMSNVSGLGNPDGVKKALDLYTKVRYLQKLNGGRGIVFATATPVMNSMSEMYIMQKYLQPDLLKQLGISSFDAWAKQFGEVVNGVEIKPSGNGYRIKQSFSRFKNLPELQLLFRNFADVLTDIPGLKIPKMKGGKVKTEVCQPGAFQKNFMDELEKRADNIRSVDPSVDNMLKITSDGRKAAYTQRMIDPSLPYEDGCKIMRCVDNVVQEYTASKDILGTQLVFCDMATPKGKDKKKAESPEVDEDTFDAESAKLYEDMRSMMVKRGIPADKIAFIHEAKTDAQRKKLFADVNAGKIRILIGSTAKMGVGMNAQKRVVAIHHLDAPWRPGDVEQRNGRAFRQGNVNAEVSCYTYVTEGSFDARLWDILERKQSFINQAMNGENMGREMEDTGEVTLSAAEVKALASGSPLIMEQVELDSDIKKLEGLKRTHVAAIANAKARLEADIGKMAVLEKCIDNGTADLATRTDTYSDGKFSIKVGKQRFTDKKEAGTALYTAALSNAREEAYTKIGEFSGFELSVIKTPEGIKGRISGKQGYPFNTYPNNTTHMISHLISVVQGIDTKVENWEQTLAETKKDVLEQQALIDAPFAKQQELDQKRTRYNEVMELLNPKEEQNLERLDDNDVQYQSRSYLDGDLEPASAREWSVFNRSFADQTNDLKKGEHRNIVITTADNIYLIRADGYMSGEICQKIGISGNENLIRSIWRKFTDGVDGTAGKVNSTTETQGRFHGGDNGNPVDPQESRTAENPTGLDFDESEGDSVGYYWNNYGYSSYDELQEALISGAMVMDEDGNLIQQHQQRTDTLTDREVLETAANDLQLDHLTESERATLDIFKARLDRLRDLEEQRKELGTLYREQQFGANGVKVDREAAAKTRERMVTMDKKIQRANADVLSVEDKQVLKEVLHKARKIVEMEERQHGEETLKRWRDRRNNAAAIKKYRTRIQKDVSDMTKWVTQPDNKDVVKHIPDALKTSVLPFLSSIDMTSKRSLRGGDPTKADQEFVKRLEAMQKALQSVNREEDLYSGFYDLPVDFQEKLQNLVHTVQELVKNQPEAFVLNQMTSAELKDLSDVVRAVKKLVQDCNRLHNNAMFAHVYEAGDSTISALGAMSDAPSKSRAGQTANKFLFWQQIRPAYAWERFGEGGKAIFDGLRKGQAQLAFDANSILQYSQNAYTEAEVKAWEKEVKTIDLDGDMVKIPVSHIMSFYCLSHRKHALNHIISQAGGIRVATFRNGKQVTADTGHRLTIEDVETIIGELTPRQMEVADKLQQYMARVGGKWRNEINFVRFGEEAPIDETYFPISSDGRHLESSADENPSAASLYALLNMSFNKPLTEGANNRIVLYSIFDVFANHMSSMAQYHSMALPVLDALKWFNYRQTEYVEREMEDGTVKTEKKTVDSVRDEMSRVYGTPEENRPGSGKRGYAETFVLNILKAFNGTEAQGTPMDTRSLKALHLYNGAQISYNLRVVMQQPLAIFRAGTILDQSTILRSLAASPQAVVADAKEMVQHSGIAAWKALGFYDVNISRGLTATIKHDESVKDKIMDFGLKGAEKADEITWAAIWRACKIQVAKDGTKPGSEKFFQKVTELFEEVIYKTQVVDSILTKNEFLRDKGVAARTLGSFMGEPTTTASMCLDAYDKYQTDRRRGFSRRAAIMRNKEMIVRTTYTYGVSAIILAAVQAVADGWRDDDDYETMPEKWWEAFRVNFIDELMPFNKLPIISDMYELFKELRHRGFDADTYGNPPRSFYMQWYDSLVKGVAILNDKITGDDTNYTWYGGAYKLLQAASGIVGLPMAAATREVVTGWNNTVGALAPSLKVKTYDAGDRNEIRSAYRDGYLTEEEAKTELLNKGVVDTEDDAYWQIREWNDTDDSFSRYDALYDAIRSGTGFDSAMAELTTHGYKEKEVLTQAKSQIGQWYQDGEISKQQATDMLTKYFDLDADEITGIVNKWSCKVVTGTGYGDIKSEYFDGKITKSRAIEMRMRYGGESKEKATEAVTKWDAEKNTGVAYDDIKDAFMEGSITEAEVRDMYITYGGKSESDAKEAAAVMAFVKEHPDCEDISYAAIEDYTTYCESAGISAKIFYDTWKYKSKIRADVDENGESIFGSKKEKVLDYINSLPLSGNQKDALYYSFGWAESKLYEAPWH